MSTELHLLAMLLCVAASAFFSGTESGLITVNHARLTHLVRSGSRAAAIRGAYVADMQRVLATILVGNNLVNVMLSTLSASLAQMLLPKHAALQTAWATAVACAMLVFCEYLPKLFFTTRPLRRTLMVARLFYVVEKALSPLAAFVLFLTKWLVPESRGASEQRFFMTREYIQNVVSDPRDGSRITAVERLMINRVLTLQSLTAAQVMTPLSRVTRTTELAALSACFQLVRDSGHVRLPVFSADGAKCVAVFSALDVLESGADPREARVRDFMRPPLFVSDDLRADDVLPLMRKSRQPMAMVRSARDGAVLGIITEENILRSLTGSL
jgi:CBS domain containing-hemolysin-like protein